MNRFSLLLCLCLMGCVPAPSRKDAIPEPVPVVTSAVEQAAHDAILDYAKRLAQSADKSAADTSKYLSLDEVFKEMSEANSEARKAAFGPYEDALDKAAVPEDDSYDAVRVKTALQDAAKGFTRASRGE